MFISALRTMAAALPVLLLLFWLIYNAKQEGQHSEAEEVREHLQELSK